MPKNNKATITESVAKGGMSAAMPYILLGGAAYLGFRYLSTKTNPSNIAGGAIEYVREKTGSIADGVSGYVQEKTGSIKEKTKEIIDKGNENAILKYITPDIQRPSEMTGTQQIALENYKKGNVTTKTVAAEGSLYNKIFGGKTSSIDPVAMGIPGANIANDIAGLTKQIQSGKVPETININGKTLTKVTPPGVNIANDIAELTKQIQSGKVPETININGKTLTKVTPPSTVKASSGGYSVARESGTTVNRGKYETIKVKKK
jgi:hypothetical protein